MGGTAGTGGAGGAGCGCASTALAANPQAQSWVVHDLNADTTLPFADDAFDHATCCVSVDYLTQPVAVFRDIARVVRAGGLFVCTFSTGSAGTNQVTLTMLVFFTNSKPGDGAGHETMTWSDLTRFRVRCGEPGVCNKRRVQAA